jgi:PAS domain S-box-containing protein
VPPVVAPAAPAAPEQTLLDHLTQSVFLKDCECRFVAVNQAFCTGLGHPRSAILGRDDFAFYPRGMAEKFRADDLRILREGVTLEVEEQNLLGDQLRTVRVVKAPVRGSDGAIRGLIGIFWDVTETRHLETQLRQAQKLNAVAQLAGGIAHDFNNMLTVVLGNLALAQLELARLAHPETPAIAELLRCAESAGHRAADLTRQLLLFSRRAQPRLEPASLNDCVQQILAAFPLGQAIQVAQHLESKLNRCQLDVGQIKQAVRQLLANAHDAMPQGGALLVQTQNVTLIPESAAHRPQPPGLTTVIAPVMHPDARTGEFVRLRISDAGPGMSPDVLAKRFEQFESAKGLGRGPGLSLAMVASIAKDHEGWIEWHSAPGQGTRFDLYLPRMFAPATAPAAPEDDSAPILRIEDRKAARKLGRV